MSEWKCDKCGSGEYACEDKAEGSGGMDWIDYTHECLGCGAKEKTTETHTDFGDHDWNCPMCGRDPYAE